MKQFLTIATVLMLTPLATMAEEGGMVALEYGSETYEFSLWAEQSDWSGYEAYGAVFGDANIYTRPTDEVTRALFNQLTLGFSLEKTGADAPEISLYRLVDGELVRLFGKEDTAAEVILDEVTVDGDFLILTGSFSGDLGPSSNYGRDIDLSDPVAISGSFNVILGPVE